LVADRVEVRFRLLGPVEVWAGSTQLVVGGPRQYGVLAALAVDAGRLVPVEVLVDRVWGEDPPERARRTLHTHITRLRRCLERGPAASDPNVRITRRAGGYVLEVDPDEVDLHRFRRLLEASRGAGRDGERLGLLREAVGCWRGDPLTGVAGEWAGRLRDSWRQEHLAAVVAWADAELRAGEPAVVPAPVRVLLDEFPLAEPLAAVLMRAYAATGRTADALDVYAPLRERLADELGADPGAELQAVHLAVLRGEVSRPAASPAGAEPAPADRVAVLPAQLPGDVPGFTGRAVHLARLDAVLAAAAADAPTAVVVTAVSGTAGVGKTALAVRWAYRVADRFPDGQLYVNLRGFDPGGQVMSSAAAVRGFLDALGMPANRIPADHDAQAALYRSLLAGRRMLVVIDNARDAAHARPLLPGTPTAVAVVTSRDPLTGLVAADGAHSLSLDLLTAEEARELLASRIEPGRTAAEPRAVEEIITACARLPLALAIVAARAAAHPTFPLTALAAELTTASGQAGRLDADDVLGQVRAVFSWSYTTLTRDAARLFRLLGLHPGPDSSAPAAASLTATPLASTHRSLVELTHAGLLTEHAPGRYGFHDLLRAYAADFTQTVDSDDQRMAAITRLLDHYTHTAHTAARLASPARDQIQLPLAPPAAGVTPEQPADLRAALAWLTAEHPVLLAAQRVADGSGFETHTWHLAWALHTVLYRRGHWHDLASVWETALAAADRLGNLTATAQAHRLLAQAGSLLGRHDEAHTHLRRALDLFAEAGDMVGQAHTHRALGGMWDRRGRPDRALDHAQQALTLFGAIGNRRGRANALNNIGWCYVLLGDHTRAVTRCRQALALFQELGDRDGEAAAWDSLGYAHHHLAQHPEAADCYHHALTLYRDLGDRYDEADTQTHLGDTHHAAGQPDQARTAWAAALDIFADLNHPGAGTVRAKLATLDQTPAPPAEPGTSSTALTAGEAEPPPVGGPARSDQ